MIPNVGFTKLKPLQYALLGFVALAADVVIHLSAVAHMLDSGTITVVSQFIITGATSAFVGAGLSGFQTQTTNQVQQVVDQTNGTLQQGVAARVADVLDQKGITDTAAAAKKVLDTADTAAANLAAMVAKNLAAIQAAQQTVPVDVGNEVRTVLDEKGITGPADVVQTAGVKIVTVPDPRFPTTPTPATPTR